ncbi:glycosyltransferase family 39 protein [Leptolyngbya sp. FACHB-321]|uniref:ArnT family glycosyltransferase n=1 Tax=Leptolyngbya sp. FACHB-321 TaxID=2692807 RepID=UPI0016892E5A|nr:glycosyltransferase family 39 protein [Leptolyngbya sp. FACHB-321]MBD2035807.1 glycosyltransferase family 39 protein [Leptolyngbya sp. FACHB-321]
MQAIKKWLTQRENKQLVSLLVGGFLLRSAIALWLPVGFDEGYYYLYSLHPDWSYFDHPLLVALTTGFGPLLTHTVSPFTIRLGSLLLHTGSLLLLYLTSVRLFSRQAAILTLAIATLIPIFQLGFGVLTLPDSPLMFFWTATLYVAVCEFFDQQEDKESQQPREADHSLPLLPPYFSPYRPTYRLAIVGLLIGLACLSKYYGLALGFGLIGFCLTSPRYRLALLSPWTLASLGLFTLAVLPIVIWNAQHDWVSLRFQSGRAVPDRGYSVLDLLVTFLVGVGYLFPTFGFPLWWVSGKAAIELINRRRSVKTQKRRRAEAQGSRESKSKETGSYALALSPLPSPKTAFLLWLSLPLMLTFTFMGGYRAILPTWAMPGFWSATLLLGQQAVSWQQRSPKVIKHWLWGSGWVVTSVLLLLLLHLTLGTLQKPSRYALLGGFLTPSNDASTQLIDIQQLRQGFASPLLTAAMSQANFVFTNDLFLAGQVGMAIAPLQPKPITCFDQDLRGFAFWSTPDQWVGQDGLLVTSASQSSRTVKQYQAYFQTIQKVADLPIRRGGAIVQVVEVYQCQRLLKPYPRPYGQS